MNRQILLIEVGGLLLLAGCAGRDLPPQPSNSPANADAAESPVPQSQTLALNPSEPSPADAPPGDMTADEMRHEMQHPASADAPASGPVTSASQIYVCPMHAKVVSKQPGNCPICGMKLKPKAAQSGEPDHAGHGGRHD